MTFLKWYTLGLLAWCAVYQAYSAVTLEEKKPRQLAAGAALIFVPPIIWVALQL